MDVVIERAKEEDAEETRRVMLICFKCLIEKYQPELDSIAQTSLARMMVLFKNHIFYNVFFKDKIIGGVHIVENLENNHYLDKIYILPEYQNLGLGQRVLDFVEKDHPDARLWTLLTGVDDAINNYFYLKNGYIKYGEYEKSQKLTLNQYKKEVEKMNSQLQIVYNFLSSTEFK